VRIAVALGLLVALQSQTFEVASIRPYNGDDDSWSVGPRPGGGFNAERARSHGVASKTMTLRPPPYRSADWCEACLDVHID
jgi:hypothetical protein